MAVKPGRLATPNLRNWSTTQKKMERIMVGANHEGQKKYKLDPETEWCDRHYEECKRKQTQMGGARGEETRQLMDRVTEWIPCGHKRP